MARSKRTPKSKVRNLVDNAGAIAMAGRVALKNLETVFGERVTQVVRRLGVPSHAEVQDLSRQVAALQASVERLRRTRARA